MSFKPITALTVKLLLRGSTHVVGKLAIIKRDIFFEYDPTFISKGLEVSPLKLPLERGAVSIDDYVFEGLFGVFNDSLPDGWGRLLLDRKVQALGVAPEILTPLDRLAYVGGHGMGALIYEPTVEVEHGPGEIDLSRLAEEAINVLEGEADDVVGELLELSGASAGARPKIMIGVSTDRKILVHGQQTLAPDYEHWMIKFSSKVDQKESGRIEYAYSLMAREAGLEVMPTHLFVKGKEAYFGTKRFDRLGNDRLHLHSLSGLMHQSHTVPSLDYLTILKVTQFLTKDQQEVLKTFRLACFNVFSHNRDDHAKNFSYVMNESGQWKMSPAYDLIFSGGPGGEHHTSIVGEGRTPGASNLLELAKQYGIKKKDAEIVIEKVRASTSKWPDFANQAGLSKRVAESIHKVIVAIN